MLKIRLRRTGARKKPSYRIVVAEATAPRDGKYVEIIGTYDPLTDPSTIKLDGDRAKHWLSVGAQPTDRVYKLMAREGLVEARTYATDGTDGAASAETAPPATAQAAPAATATTAAAPEAAAPAPTESADDTAEPATAETEPAAIAEVEDTATAESAAASSAVDDGDAEAATPAPKRPRARTPKAKADAATEERAPVEADAQ